MTQDKMRKLIAALVSAGTVLFVLLLCYLVYQWVTLGVLKKREDKLNQEIAAYEQTIEKGTNEAEYYESVIGKNWLAIHQGWQAGEE